MTALNDPSSAPDTGNSPISPTDGPVFTSPGGKQLISDIVHYVFSILEAQGACGTLAKLQSCSQTIYRIVNPYLYRHLYLFRSTFDKLFGLLPEIQARESWSSESAWLPPTPVDPHGSSIRWMKLPQFQRLKSLFTLIQHITLTFDVGEDLWGSTEEGSETSKIAKRLTLHAEYHCRLAQNSFFPEVKTIRFLGSRVYPYYPGSVWSALFASCQPQYVCFKYLSPNVPNLYSHNISLTSVNDEKKGVILHGVDQHFLPITCTVPVRLSYIKQKSGSEVFDQDHVTSSVWSEQFGTSQKFLNWNEENNKTKTFRIIAGDGISTEDEEGLGLIRERMRWYKHTNSTSISTSIGSLLENLIWIDNKEALKEPPCEVCGGELDQIR
ncbi:uncharacterized protein L201_004314 [Kwoniella dendrophila CBS 6074]|uniref:F-box domain-containing protein n=1 Tax=Kwoniella dendrophila CBS 6074 TaxID=1295534 RepID=A0AAX4JVV4_9TREE